MTAPASHEPLGRGTRPAHDDRAAHLPGHHRGNVPATGPAIRARAAPQREPQAEYLRRRARQIAYGRWEPWADSAPVRDHVASLRRHGASYCAIGQAAGVSASTVHRLMRGCPHAPQADRIGCRQAARLLAVTPDAAVTRNACGARRRLQALIAIGYSPPDLARRIEVPSRRVRRLIAGQTQTVPASLHAAARRAYEDLWDRVPPEHTIAEQSAARKARQLAEANGWPPPMALDDDRIDEPGYRTRTGWRRAAGLPAVPVRGHCGHSGSETGHGASRTAR